MPERAKNAGRGKNIAGGAGYYRFVLPNLPPPEYNALQKMCKLLSRPDRVATQFELVNIGIHLLAHAIKGEKPLLSGPEVVAHELEMFRNTPPSETPPLL